MGEGQQTEVTEVEGRREEAGEWRGADRGWRSGVAGQSMGEGQQAEAAGVEGRREDGIGGPPTGRWAGLASRCRRFLLRLRAEVSACVWSLQSRALAALDLTPRSARAESH